MMIMIILCAVVNGMTNYHSGPHRTPWYSLRHLGTCYNNKNTSSKEVIPAETTFL